MAVFTGNGSATAPSFTFSSDTNLGIFRGGTDILSFATANAERARLNATGELEMGGTLGSDPNVKLDQDGNGFFFNSIDVNNTRDANNDDRYGVWLAYSGTRANGAGSVSVWQTNTATRTATAFDLNYGDGSNNRVISGKIRHDGSSWFAGDTDIGGSEASPNISLNADGSAEFSGASAQTLVTATSGTGKIGLVRGSTQFEVSATTSNCYLGTQSNTSLDFRTNGSNVARLNTSGDLLIGGTLPSAPNISLNANGSVVASTSCVAVVPGTGQSGLYSDGLIYSLASTNDANFVQFQLKSNIGGNAVEKIAFKADGSATFAADINVNGLTVGRGGGDVSGNTAIGIQALNATATGTQNTAIGRIALRDNTSGSQNTAVGNSSLENTTTGSYNSALADSSLKDNVDGDRNCAFGYQALQTSVAGDNGTAFGTESQQFANNTTTPFGNTNVSFGYRSLRGSTTAANNTGLGNTAVGYQSMLNNTSGGLNTAIGFQAMNSSTTATSCTAVGYEALANSDGNSNTGVGVLALTGNTTGADNSSVGQDSLRYNTTGGTNTAIGNRAGAFQQGGSNNTNYDNCTYLGYDTRASGSNQVQLGDSNTTTYAYGSVQNRSDERDKTDIRDTLLGLDFVKSLRPVDFRWDYRDDYFDREEYEEDETRTRQVANPDYVEGGDEPEFLEEEYTETVTKERLVPVTKDGSRARTRFHHGLIAQEVKTAADAQGVDFAGYQDHSVNGGLDVLSIGYNEMIAPLIKAVQELSAENADLKARLDAAGI